MKQLDSSLVNSSNLFAESQPSSKYDIFEFTDNTASGCVHPIQLMFNHSFAGVLHATSGQHQIEGIRSNVQSESKLAQVARTDI